jgi:hypothetical protein
MKIHHAATLALAAWYLVLPPAAPSGKRLIDAPLLDWKRVDGFDSESTCLQMRAKLIERMRGTEIDTALCVPSGVRDLAPGQQPAIVDDLDEQGGG